MFVTANSVVILLQEIFSTFGVPFLLKIKQGETLSKVKERIQKRIDVPDKEFEKVI